jgi:hypothetical protein
VPIIVLALLLFAVPALAQPASGTTPSGLFYEVSDAGDPIVPIHAGHGDLKDVLDAPQR